MKRKRKAPFGSWTSPISAADAVARSTELRQGFGQSQVDDSYLYWIEGRPQEGGRSVVCRRDSVGIIADISPAGRSVRTRVHEYGGGDFTVAGGILYFVDQADQRIYAVPADGTEDASPLSLTDTGRCADLVIDSSRRRLLCIREMHSGDTEPVNSLIALDLIDGSLVTLATGADFYAAPALSPCGDRLAWLQWNHPNMPWDACELWLADVDGRGVPRDARCIAGGLRESIFQPAWAPDATLYFISDRSGWSNLYRWDGGEAHCVTARAADFAAPLWNFATSTYGFLSADVAVCALASGGRWHLARVDLRSGDLQPLPVDHTDIAHVRVAGSTVYFRGGSPTLPPCLVAFDLDSATTDLVRRPAGVDLGAADISLPEAIEFESNNSRAHAFYYAPRNDHFAGADGSKPPLIVIGHGGPTAAAGTALDLKIQFWTSRGFAVVDVNYRGSTGFGRAYREALNGQWGVADVEDCVAAARYLVARGDVDPQRHAIRGSSAGGFTCLSALTFHDVFRAGACYYGISDLEALLRDTHKFESHYTDTLIGPYPAQRDLYRRRSPIHHVERLSCPLIVFQGMRDEVVPPSQSELLVTALQRKGLPVAYLTFADEGHGFRNAANAQRALEAELYFYARIFGFTAADDVPPIVIENLAIND